MKTNAKVKLTKEMIGMIKRDWNKPCRSFLPSCANCQAQWALGWLADYLEDLEWELKGEQ